MSVARKLQDQRLYQNMNSKDEELACETLVVTGTGAWMKKGHFRATKFSLMLVAVCQISCPS